MSAPDDRQVEAVKKYQHAKARYDETMDKVFTSGRAGTIHEPLRQEVAATWNELVVAQADLMAAYADPFLQ